MGGAPAATAGTAAPTPTTTSPATPGAAPAPTPPPAGAEGLGYAVRGDGPGFGFGPTIGASTGATAHAPSSAVSAAAALACNPATGKSRRRRRRTIEDRGYRHEYATMDDHTPAGPQDPVTAMASGSGAGRLGFAGVHTASTAVEATGLSTLDGDAENRTIPMLPGTWDVTDDDR